MQIENKKNYEHFVPTYGEGFFGNNKDFISQIKDENSHYIKVWVESIKSEKVAVRYDALKSFTLFLQDTKKLCDSKGSNFSTWFSDTIADDEYIEQRCSELQQMDLNMEILLEKEKHLQHLDERLIKIIKENSPILQTEIYKLFTLDIQSELQEKIYYLEKNKVITRTKSGRTYVVTVL